MVEAGDTFPNGAMTPDDCHRFCRCSAYELSVPDTGDGTQTSADDLATQDSATLVALYAIGFLASRHDRDVAEQAHQAQQTTPLPLGDEDEDEDTPSPPPPPAPKPKPRPRRRRAH